MGQDISFKRLQSTEHKKKCNRKTGVFLYLSLGSSCDFYSISPFLTFTSLTKLSSPTTGTTAAAARWISLPSSHALSGHPANLPDTNVSKPPPQLTVGLLPLMCINPHPPSLPFWVHHSLPPTGN